jgi:uncharacterized protein (DUF305 family)
MRQGVVLMTMLTNVRLFALLMTVAVLVAACGGAGGGQQDNKSGGNKREAAEKNGSGMSGMDSGSPGMGSKAMAKQMVMEDGQYSDKAFIDAMVPHHQGAIEMARVALENAEREEIRELSQDIISSQQAEIRELMDIKKEEFGTSQVPMDMSRGQMKGMGMVDPQRLAKGEPFDEAFINAMIPHHQSAIEMAAVANEETENPRIEELAANIVSAQKREIVQMKRWREQWYPEG